MGYVMILRSLLWVSGGQAADEYLVMNDNGLQSFVTNRKYPEPPGKIEILLVKGSDGLLNLLSALDLLASSIMPSCAHLFYKWI